MKLDLDCVRDVLLFLESNLSVDDNGYAQGLTLDNVCSGDLGEKYERGTIVYTFQKLIEARFVTAVDVSTLNGFNLQFSGSSGITFAGHNYLDSIREKDIWDKVRSQLAKVGGSVPLSVASALGTEYLKRLLFPSA